jgi:DNA replication protein DnaC
MRNWFKRIATAAVRRGEDRPLDAAADAATTSLSRRSAEKLAGPLLAGKAAPAAHCVSPPRAVLARSDGGGGAETAPDALLLAQRLKILHLPDFAAEHARLARHRGAGGDLDHRRHLLHLAGHELAVRDRRKAERLVRAAGFPSAPEPDGFDFAAAPALDVDLVLELAGCGYVERGENVIALGGDRRGHSGLTGRLLVALGVAACRNGFPVRYATAAALADELVAAFDERRLLALHRRLDACRLLIIDELGPAPLSPTGASLLFEVFSRRSERLATIVASALPPIAWVRVFGSTRLADAVVERLAYRAHRLDLGGVDPLPWAAPANDRGNPVWHAEPLTSPLVASPAAASAGAREIRAGTAAAIEAPLRSA